MDALPGPVGAKSWAEHVERVLMCTISRFFRELAGHEVELTV
eukprot:COSAG02_NODE_12984_length_1464_cov_2.663004_2_plen_42_part_00